ncbi:amidase signature domain-containing protein [Fomitopsis serialis]|uniref:amidase signature domain-containing protein n=1 Tax=Fomitopsis serialis TaxID=139415 RepID=UPI002008CC75|nr:amidase signature domain-containing protein [Neoantrodia serialis]KAH9928393.1 amidase signature domain-containing protein [Neoantrodia serialis]
MSASLTDPPAPKQSPVTRDVLQQTAAKIGICVPAEKEDEFTDMLASAREAMQQVLAMDDYYPVPEVQRYPRTDIATVASGENPYNAWATKVVVEDVNKEEAEAGILTGKRVVLKDNVCLAGVPCHFGTDVFTDWVPQTDATVVTRVLEAGGTIVGKATCESFSAFGISNTSALGPVGNPYDKIRSAGGSSSGCGVLVVIGEADLAIGGDQGGSIRLPASHVGIVGLKPTFGLVPYTGIVSNEVSLDHTGPMSPDVLSNALLLRAIAGTDGIDDRQIAGTPSRAHVPDYPALLTAARARPGALLQVGLPSDATASEPGQTRKMRVGILKEGGMCQAADPRVVECVTRAARKFEDLGAEVVEVSVPGHVQASLIGRVQRFSQANNMLGRASGTRQLYLTDFVEKVLPWNQEKFDKLFANSANILINGIYADEHYPQLHGKTHNLFRRLRSEYDAVLENVDVLVMPTVPWVPKVMQTAVYSLGMLSPPEGPDDLRLPIGMQLVGRFWEELTLYKAALAWSDACNWKEL